MRVLSHILLLLFVTSCQPKEVSKKESLLTFTKRAMEMCKAAGTEGAKLVLAHQVTRAVEEMLAGRPAQEAAILLVCIESRFNYRAKSSAGAVGLTQVMPQYVKEFAARAGIPGQITADDLLDSEINLRIGIGQFRYLLSQHGQNVALALASYNAGLTSSTTKKTAALLPSNRETEGYLAKFFTAKQLLAQER
jgi:hypothetical protein